MCDLILIAIAHAKPIQTQVRIDARMELELESHFCIKSDWQLTAVRREKDVFLLRLRHLVGSPCSRKDHKPEFGFEKRKTKPEVG